MWGWSDGEGQASLVPVLRRNQGPFGWAESFSSHNTYYKRKALP